MKILRLTFRDFRNLTTSELLPGEGMNILYGANGQGKTNLLEAIYLLSNLSSFRPTPLKEMVRYGRDHSTIQGRVLSQTLSKDLSVFISPQGKVVKVNGKTVSRAVDYYGEFPVILFSPETLVLVQGGPRCRRRFLDSAISRKDRRFLLDLKEYKKVLEQRNRLLRMAREGRVQKGTLKVWNEQLVERGSRILERRFRYLAELAPVCTEIFKGFLQKKGTPRISYHSSLFRRSKLQGPAMEGAELMTSFSDALERIAQKEVDHGTTLLGPHLDDVSFVIEDRPAKTFASQGEIRMFSLSLTLGEALLYQRETGVFPVLLLDDVNSELDRTRRLLLREQLLSFGQVFLTTTEAESGQEEIPGVRRFRVEQGEIFLVKKGEKE